MIEAIILAAGSSQRMGKDNKLLKAYYDEVIISHVVKQVLGSAAKRVIVVTGHEDKEVRAALEGLPVEIIHNPDHLNGQLWSIRAGITHISSFAEGIMILLGDMPLLSSDHINRVIDNFEVVRQQQDNLITRPMRGADVGHPTIWAASLKAAILEYPHDERLKGLIQQYQSSFKPLQVSEDQYFVDIDTTEDYDHLVS